ETGQLVDQRLGWERIKLFDTQKINIIDATLFALFVKIVIDLARAKDDTADLRILLQLDRLVLQQLRIVPQQAVEGGIAREITDRRNSTLVAQQRFRRHQDQR